MIRVAFVLAFDDGWLGGLNYFNNLLTAIYSQSNRNIEAIVFTADNAKKSYLKDLPNIKVVYSKMLRRNSINWIFRKVIQFIYGHDIFFERLLKTHKIEVLSHSGCIGNGASIRCINWIPDFQFYHLPEFFTQKEVACRIKQYEWLCRNSDCILLSSFDAQKDLSTIFPNYYSKTEVLQFVATVNQENIPTLSELNAKYGFSGRFFLVPNQFWAHKNHRVLIKALGILKSKGHDLLILATGNNFDHRQPKFFIELMDYVKENNVEINFKILGVIPKNDLEGLMNYAIALINPSLFEGWNTSVEEAKTLGKRIILSDIAVHREQNPDNGLYFSPDDANALANLMLDLVGNDQDSNLLNKNYNESFLIRREQFGNKYQSIVTKLIALHDIKAL